MNHKKTHQTNPMAPWDSLDVSLNPLEPPAPPNRPPGTPKQVSWPHRLLRSPELHHKSSEDPSNVAADPLEHLTPPLDSLGPCRPTPWPPETL